MMTRAPPRLHPAMELVIRAFGLDDNTCVRLSNILRCESADTDVTLGSAQALGGPCLSSTLP
jgi:hypothetical protein